MTSVRHLTTLFLAILMVCAPELRAQTTYPVKPIRLILPFGPGGATDTVARMIAAGLGERLGQQVVVDNRPGAEGAIGIEAGVKSAPDGYTIVWGSNTTLAANYYLRKNLPFHPVNDLTPIALAAKNVFNMFIVHPSVKAGTLQELIALAKAQPGKLNYGTGTSGSKLCTEMFKTAAGVDITAVAYKSSPQALTDLMGGQIQVLCEPVVTSVANIAAGRIRGLAVTSPTRLPALPNVPTVAESGFPGFEYSAWVALFAPKGTPPAIVSRLSKEIGAVLSQPEVRGKIQAAGFEPSYAGPAELAKKLNDEMEKAGAVVKAAKLLAE